MTTENNEEGTSGGSALTDGLATATRGFMIKAEGGRTGVQVSEFSDGTLQILLVTDRDGMDPLITSMRICGETFTLLSEALCRAAHDKSVWHAVCVDNAE